MNLPLKWRTTLLMGFKNFKPMFHSRNNRREPAELYHTFSSHKPCRDREAVEGKMLRKDKVLREEVVSEIGGNRRDRHRYDIDLNVHYKVLGQCRVGQSGTGRTVNLSGGGLAITIGDVVSPGSAIEVAVAWPQMLNGNCPLKLVITGKVVRSTSLMTAIRMERYEFRTQGMRTMQVSAAAFSA